MPIFSIHVGVFLKVLKGKGNEVLKVPKIELKEEPKKLK